MYPADTVTLYPGSEAGEYLRPEEPLPRRGVYNRGPGPGGEYLTGDRHRGGAGHGGTEAASVGGHGHQPGWGRVRITATQKLEG